MAKPKTYQKDIILDALDVESRAVAVRFLDEMKAAADEAPKIEPFVEGVPQEKRADLRVALEQLALGSDSEKTSTRRADTTFIHSGVTTQSGVSDESTTDPQMTLELQGKSADDSNSDMTIDLPALGLGNGMLATMEPSQDSAPSQRDFQFTWDPSGPTEEEVPRGNLPTVDGYQILGELGRGGMGVVYKARQRGLMRTVALKMILAGGHAGREQLERFRAEAQAVAQLQHPNIVQIYDVGERDGLPFFALEFIDGPALDDSIDGQPQLTAHAAEIVEQLANAMHYAHEQGIVHRDLKPANILLTQDGVPKVTDFGLVKRLEADSGQTRTGTIMGTPSYMAPEQARGESKIGPAADTYALGSILYTMLTGRPPFMGPSALDTVMMVIRSEPVPPSRMQPKLPRDIEIICLKCLQKEPDKRYATAGELAEDLRRFRVGEPIQARPVGMAERVWRWCRRNPRVAVLSSAALLLATALMIGGPSAAILINRQRNEANAARADAETNASAAQAAKVLALTAQGEAEAARNVADENAKTAANQRSLALNTLNDVVTQVEEELRDRTELGELRQKVLKLAMDGLENVSRSSDTTKLDRTIGAAHQRMGDILLRAGKANEAREQYQRALAIFDQLLDAPEGDLAQWNAALTHDGLGDVSIKQLEDAEIAREHYISALSYRNKLLTTVQSPKLPLFMIRASIANSYARIGLLLLEMAGQPRTAADFSEKAIQQSELLLVDLPDLPLAKKIAKELMAGAWNLYADTLIRNGQVEAASDYASRAANLRQELFDTNPESVKARQDLAVSDWMLGDIALCAGKTIEALGHFQAAHAIRSDLYQQDSENSEMQEDLANSFDRLGIAQLRLEKPSEAREAFERSLELRKQVLAADPDNPMKRLQLLQSQARCGDYRKAAAETDALCEDLFPLPGTLVRLAGIYATCYQRANADNNSVDAESQGCRRTALDLVNQAVERGYRDPYTLSSHADLDSIRSETEFEDAVRTASLAPDVAAVPNN